MAEIDHVFVRHSRRKLLPAKGEWQGKINQLDEMQRSAAPAAGNRLFYGNQNCSAHHRRAAL